ncbi:MAG: Peptidase putative rane-associated zinc metallopeptidase [Candidatus Sulfotelmatobacter sp.]|nr:Peptidase putative rane-associated zinc metallopeptidase [Candidatus Sulfotelmatobacter sp.]
MSDFIISVVAVAVVLGFMILIHEFGHFAVAKLLGVRVEQFAIGFGKRLIGFRRGETDYRINILPLGGYVKMSGENPMDERTGDPAEFMSHSRFHRFLIAIAGPTMNILLAIFLLTTVYMVHYEYPVFLDKPAVIEGVKHDSAAARAGLQPGDRIVKVDGIENPTWEQLQPRVWLSANQPLTITIQRGNQTFQKTIVPQPVTTSEVGSAGWYPEEPVVVGRVEADTPAAKAGIKEDDRIVAMDGQTLASIENMIERLQQSKDKPVDLTVIRGTQTLTFNLKPVLSKTEDPKEQRYRLGFLNKNETKVTTLPFTQALSLSLQQNKKYSLLILELAKKIVQRKVSLRAVSGPIGIAQDAGYAAQQKGWTPLMELTAGISLNLGIFNLLPIPILDGGVILFLLIEGLMRRDVSLRIKERVYQAAFVFLVLFAVMVIYNDLMKTLPGLMDRLP